MVHFWCQKFNIPNIVSNKNNSIYLIWVSAWVSAGVRNGGLGPECG